jgi:HSP90 family molecular chaperone
MIMEYESQKLKHMQPSPIKHNQTDEDEKWSKKSQKFHSKDLTASMNRLLGMFHACMKHYPTPRLSVVAVAFRGGSMWCR